MVATSAIRPAMRVGGNWSRSARVKALSSTRFAVDSFRKRATFPSRMVVLARMAGSSSTCSLDKCLSNDACVRCVSLGASVSTDLSVSSRMNASSSVNPVAMLLYTCSSTTLSDKWCAYLCRFSSNATRTALSADVYSLTMHGVTLAAKTASDRSRAACSMGDTASAGAVAKTSDSQICGRIFFSTGALANPSSTRGRCRKNCSFSMESFRVRLSKKVIVSTSLLANSELFSTSFFGLYLLAG
mmetsp:Transcript_30742/g.77046  ORF Transcript_30742/g.77046 Transcript_30742/m.77046 type:complete len:243 (-) Transcript_30742:882-1610(-)